MARLYCPRCKEELVLRGVVLDEPQGRLELYCGSCDRLIVQREFSEAEMKMARANMLERPVMIISCVVKVNGQEYTMEKHHVEET